MVLNKESRGHDVNGMWWGPLAPLPILICKPDPLLPVIPIHNDLITRKLSSSLIQFISLRTPSECMNKKLNWPYDLIVFELIDLMT